MKHAALIERVRARLAEHPEHVVPALRLIADPDALPQATEISAQTRAVNAARPVALRERFVAHAYRGDQVRALGGISRQALHRRVSAGRLLALHVGNASWFPDWQFATDGTPHPVLPELLGYLPASPLAADLRMRSPLPEEDRRSPADLLAARQDARALRYVRTAGSER